MQARFFWRQARLTAEAATALSAGLADVATSTAAQTLAPTHRKVTANAKRLAAKKTKASRSPKVPARARARPKPKP